MTAELAKKILISGLISGNLAISACIGKSIILLFLSSSTDRFTLCSKTQRQVFLLSSGRHVGAYPDGHQHGVSIQIYINLVKKLLLHNKNCCDLNLRGSLFIVTFFRFSDSGLNLLNCFYFYFDLF